MKTTANLRLDDSDLLDALVGKDRDAALAECIRRFGPMIKRAAWRITGDEHHADDISQAVFLVLLRQAGQLKDMKYLAGWLYRVAVLTARDVLKSESRRHWRELEAVMVTRARTPSALPDGIDEAVNRLPEIYRQVIVAHYFEGRNYPELAAQLGISEETAKKRGQRAIEQLRQGLGSTLPGLTVATLAGLLAAEAEAAAAPMSTAQIATIQAAVTTPPLVGLAGTVKGIIWTTAKIAVGVAAGVTVLVVVAAALLQAPPPPDTGLVVHYKFDEARGGTAADSCPGGNSGTLSGGASWTTGPKPDTSALRLDGTMGFVATKQDLNQWVGNTATMAFWIRTREIGDPQFHLSPAVVGIERPTGDDNDISWGRINEYGRIGISVGSEEGENNLWSTRPVNDDAWHHVALTRDAATGAVQVFLEGSADRQARLKPGVKTTPIDVIGVVEVQQIPRKFYLQCDLADLRIYNRVLTADEIRSLAR